MGVLLEIHNLNADEETDKIYIVNTNTIIKTEWMDYANIEKLEDAIVRLTLYFGDSKILSFFPVDVYTKNSELYQSYAIVISSKGFKRLIQILQKEKKLPKKKEIIK